MITVIDDLNPEDNAMLQALQSRSPALVADRLEKVRSSGSGNFMDKFYVGYGHRSIGDCGTTTIYIEGVTMLVAKAIQDWSLYSGQEASTRYMDFSKAGFADPLGPDYGGKYISGSQIQAAWRRFYLDAQEPVLAHLRERYPRNEGEDEATYERAIKARVFDTLRCFLPAGAETNLSWHTNLRQAADHLEDLLVHPDPNVATVAAQIWEAVATKYPHSFKRNNRPGVIEYMEECAKDHFLAVEDWPEFDFAKPEFDQRDLEHAGVLDLLKKRPRTAPVPRRLAEFGGIESRFRLDFGSYRDLQRHRNGIIRMPLLTTKLGFNDWYLDELPPAVRSQADDLIGAQTESIDRLECDDFTRQNYIAMGFQVPCHVVQNLPGFIYRVELRSGKTVHPSLRRLVHEEIRAFERRFPDVPLYVDMDPDSWTVRRGKQTIIER
jgi:thymidylate synthase ThyX